MKKVLALVLVLVLVLAGCGPSGSNTGNAGSAGNNNENGSGLSYSDVVVPENTANQSGGGGLIGQPKTSGEGASDEEIRKSLFGIYWAIRCSDADGTELTLDGETLGLYADGSGEFTIDDEIYQLNWKYENGEFSFVDEDGDEFHGKVAGNIISGTYFNDYRYTFTSDMELAMNILGDDFVFGRGDSPEGPGQSDQPQPSGKDPDKPEGQGGSGTGTGSGSGAGGTSAGYFSGRYTMKTLYEPQYGIKTALALVPYGWTSRVDSEWGLVSTMYPAAATIVMVSPEGDAKIEIRSIQAYFEMARNGVNVAEGTYYDFYNTILNYRNAHEFNVYMAGLLGYDTSNIVSAIGPYESAQQELDNAANALLQSLAGPTAIQALGCEGSAEKTTFSINTGGVYRIEMMSAVVAAAIQYNQIKQILWDVPYVAMFTAATPDAYSRYAGIFETVVNNSFFTGEFLYVVQRNGAYMSDMIHNYLMEKAFSPSAGDVRSWDSEYVDDGSDSFLNAWSDVIKERYDYTTEDGSVIKVGTEYDSVYQNGDDIYMGPDGQAPDGWTKLYRK